MKIKYLALVSLIAVFVWWLLDTPNEPAANKAIAPTVKPVATTEPQQTQPLPTSPTQEPAQKSEIDSAWEIQPLDPALEKTLREEFGIAQGDLKQLLVQPNMVGQLTKGDELQISTPNTTDLIEVQVTDVSTIGDVQSIAGNIQGSGTGYGVTLSQSGNVLAGSIVTEQGSWSVDTVRGVTFITNGLNTINQDDTVH